MEVRADIVVLGGSGSGNFDHCGIPGHQGGSRTCKEIVGSGSIPEIDESEIVNDRRTEEDEYDTSDRRLSADEFSNLLVVSKGKISVEDVDPSSLEWSEWVSLGPSEKKVKKMAGDPEIFKVPPIVGRRRDDGVIEIIGGLHRSEVAKKLGVKVRVIIFDNDLFSSTIDGRMDDFAIENYAYFYTKKYLKSIKTHIVVLGGSGSGNFDHCGIPGHHGGSGDCEKSKYQSTIKATHKTVEGKSNRQLANEALKAMSLIEETKQGTILNPVNLASSRMSDGRTLIQTIYEDGYVRYNDGWYIVEVDDYSLYVDVTGVALKEMGNPTYEMIDTINEKEDMEK